MTGPAAQLTCGECTRAVEFCSCCDREDCPTSICYSCLALALLVSVRQPHQHGG